MENVYRWIIRISESKLRYITALAGIIGITELIVVAELMGHDLLLVLLGVSIVSSLTTWALTGGRDELPLKVIDYLRSKLQDWMWEELPPEVRELVAEYLSLLSLTDVTLAKYKKSPGEALAEEVERVVREAEEG